MNNVQEPTSNLIGGSLLLYPKIQDKSMLFQKGENFYDTIASTVLPREPLEEQK